MTQLDASLFVFSPEAEQAQRGGLPLVALETAIIAHGLPWPRNMETGLAMEKAVREQGAAPATIAIVNGQVQIGLQRVDLERAARSPDEFPKAGVRDLPIFAARRSCASTTVGSTVYLAWKAGIRIVATGGVGGVHREYLETGDVSADLLEISRAPVAVVCSGFKSVLDLARTMEAVESMSIPIVGYRTSSLPGFLAADSGLPLEHRVENPEEAARIIMAADRMGLPGGMIISNPCPASESLDRLEVESMIAASLDAARTEGVSGKAVTPFLLTQIQELSGGRALKANQALAVENARVAGQIANALKMLG